MGDLLKLLGGNRVTKPTTNDKNKHKLGLDTIVSKWRSLGTHMIKNVPTNYEFIKTLEAPIKVAAFDLDGTLIVTKSGYTFSRGPTDWKWWSKAKEPRVIEKLKSLHQQGYLIVFFTNQGSVLNDKSSKSYINFTTKLLEIINKLTSSIGQIDILVYASCLKPKGKKSKSSASEEFHNSFRKPQIGMWKELESFLDMGDFSIDKEQCFYVGDAAGRGGDFLDSDKKFAENVGIRFNTPEEFFEETVQTEDVEEEKEEVKQERRIERRSE